jgi:hypothetical protein
MYIWDVKCVAGNVPGTGDDMKESVTQYSVFSLAAELQRAGNNMFFTRHACLKAERNVSGNLFKYDDNLLLTAVY